MSEEGIKGFAKAFSTILNRTVNDGESAVLAERTDVKENLKDKAVEDRLRKQFVRVAKPRRSTMVMSK